MPSPFRIDNCERWGWEYLGDGLFSKGDLVGWFTDNGFKKG